MNINRLKPHPAHKTIYTEPKDIREEWNDLVVSMEENGLLFPLIITEDNIIISGVRRWMVAKVLGWNEIDTRVFNGNNKEVEELIITSNTNREKTHAEKVNEALHMLNIIGNRQGKRNLPEGEKGSRYEIVASKLGAGFSKDNVAKLAKIQEHDNNNPEEQNKLIDLVKQGATINAVHNLLSNQSHEENDIEKIIESEGRYKLINEDSKKALDEIGDAEIDMCFTSFPYWNQRQYEVGNDGSGENWGEEKSLESYLDSSLEISKKIYRTLKETGSFYLNLGDTVRDKQYLLVPELLCLKIMSLGFKLVNKIIWKKKNNKPMNFEKQLQPTYEHVFHFVKDVEKFKNRVLRFNTGQKLKVKGSVGDRGKHSDRKKKKKIIITPYSRFRNFIDENKGYKDVIVSAVGSSQEIKKITGIDHPGVFPDTLPLLAILQSTEVGDKIIDVCSGSGTLGVCTLLGRSYIGVEISKEYHKCALKRMEYFNSMVDEDEIEYFESLTMAA